MASTTKKSRDDIARAAIATGKGPFAKSSITTFRIPLKGGPKNGNTLAVEALPDGTPPKSYKCTQDSGGRGDISLTHHVTGGSWVLGDYVLHTYYRPDKDHHDYEYVWGDAFAPIPVEEDVTVQSCPYCGGKPEFGAATRGYFAMCYKPDVADHPLVSVNGRDKNDVKRAWNKMVEHHKGEKIAPIHATEVESAIQDEDLSAAFDKIKRSRAENKDAWGKAKNYVVGVAHTAAMRAEMIAEEVYRQELAKYEAEYKRQYMERAVNPPRIAGERHTILYVDDVIGDKSPPAVAREKRAVPRLTKAKRR